MIIYLNGQFVPAGKPRIFDNDRGFTLGEGVFDTMLAHDGAPVMAEEHFTRLKRHAAILGLATDISETALIETANELLAQNNFGAGRYAIRTTIAGGPAPRGLAQPKRPETTLLMQASGTPEQSGSTPFRAIIARNTRRNEFSPLSRIKSLNYGDQILAIQEARERGMDEAIMTNTAGNICCATTSNIFIVENGALVTPPLEDGVMDGITRQGLINTHHALEETITRERLMVAQNVFLTNSISGIRPLNEIEGHKYPENSDFLSKLAA